MEKTIFLRAINFAALKHKDQRRKDFASTPYINHPFAVDLIILEIGKVYDIDILIAAILHDTLEDTDTKPEEIQKEFGERVCSIVKELSDNKNLLKSERKRKQIENAEKLSKEAVIIKLADKTQNVLDI